jgi:hypothetical protein
MKFPLTTRFFDRSTGAAVPGLIQAATSRDLLLWTAWQYQPKDEDREWDWWGIFLECQAAPERYECYASLARERLQGLLVLDLATRTTTGGEAITIDYLSTNPANRNPNGGLKHIGTSLVTAAVVRSLERGANGALWLESLPGAAKFYHNLGMAPQPGKSPEGNLIYEFNPASAQHLLDVMKARGIVVP